MSDPNPKLEVSARAFNRVLAIACAMVIILAIPLFIIAHALEGGFDRFSRTAAYEFPSMPSAAVQTDDSGTAIGQTIYIPLYSHIYVEDGQAFRLAATLSIRNTDLRHPVTINSIRYYDTAGTFVRDYLERPLIIGALATTEFFVKEKDYIGGAGAKFLVEWTAQADTHPPVFESIMVGTAGNQGISFSRTGVVLEETTGAR